MVESIDNSGINSLGGFVFQIDVFILNALKLKPDETIEYEKVEDVSIRKKEDLDQKEDSFKTNLISSDSRQVIQVKRKEITNAVAERVLMNWLLLENSDTNIAKYILWGDASYKNACDIKKIKVKDLFNKIRKTTDRSKKSIPKRLKNTFENDYKSFFKIAKQVINKTDFIQSKPVNEILLEDASEIFHKDGVFDAIYIARINSLRNRISFNILEAIKKKKAYDLDYKTFREMIEDITIRLTNDLPLISYTEYTKANPVHLQNIENLREVIQLKHCKLDNSSIVRRMCRCNYYQDYAYRLKALARISQIEDIETATFENFEDVKENLIYHGKDKPRERLVQTEDKENFACPNEHIRKGACIYLTKDAEITGDRQISWKDDTNEET